MWTLIVDAIAQSTWVEQGILLLLVAFSIVSWGLILMKIRALRIARRRNEAFLSLFNQHETIRVGPRPGSDSAKTQFGPMEAVYEAAVATLARDSRLPPTKLHEKVMLNMQHASKEEMAMLRWGSGFLASVGSSSPFIGLLGTVLGIMGTFHVLGKQKTATLNVVGPFHLGRPDRHGGRPVRRHPVSHGLQLGARPRRGHRRGDRHVHRADGFPHPHAREANGDASDNGEAATTEAVAAVRGV